MANTVTFKIIGERYHEASAVSQDTCEIPFGRLVKKSIKQLQGELPSAFGQPFSSCFSEIWATTSSALLSYWALRLNGLTETAFGKLLEGRGVHLDDQRLQITKMEFNTEKFFACYDLRLERDLEEDHIFFQRRGEIVAPHKVDLAMNGFIKRPHEKYYPQQEYDCRFEKGLVSRIKFKEFLQESEKNFHLDDIRVPSGAFIESAIDLSWLFPRADINMSSLVISALMQQWFNK